MATAITPTLSDKKIDVLCAVAEAAAGRGEAALRDIAACCPTVKDVTPVLRALRHEGLICRRGDSAALTATGATLCRTL